MIGSPKEQMVIILTRNINNEPDGTELAYLERVRQHLGYDMYPYLRLIYDAEFFIRDQVYRQAADEDAKKSKSQGTDISGFHDFIGYSDRLYNQYMDLGYPHDSIRGVNPRSRKFKISMPGEESDYSISMSDFKSVQIIVEEYRKYAESRMNQESIETTNPKGEYEIKDHEIRDIAKRISSKGTSNWKENTIYKFLKSCSEYPDKTIEGKRKIAINSCVDDNTKKQLIEVPDKTLYYWRDQLKNR